MNANYIQELRTSVCDFILFFSGLAFRICSETGLWLGRNMKEMSRQGWTNYTPCFPNEVQTLFVKVYDQATDEKAWVSTVPTNVLLKNSEKYNLFTLIYNCIKNTFQNFRFFIDK